MYVVCVTFMSTGYMTYVTNTNYELATERWFWYQPETPLFNTKHTCVCVLIHTRICFFIVMVNRMKKYRTRIGQKTGMLKKSNIVHIMPINSAFIVLYLKIISYVQQVG